MRTLIVSNMYPSKEKSFAGIFVKNQFERLKELFQPEDSIEIFYMQRKFTSKSGSILKYISTAIKFIPHLFKKYDVIHLHYFFPLIYLVFIYKKLHPKTKLIVTYHGSDLTKKVTSKNKERLQKLAKIVDVHIPVGKALSWHLKEKLNVKANYLLPVGVNDSVFYFEESKKVYDFIYVGSLVHRKGVDLIIEVARRMNNNINLVIIGEGDYSDEIEVLTSNHQNITFYKGLSQNKIQKIMVKSKFLLLPTRNEGFPTSTIEAMFCGVPVLVSDIPQTKEQVDEGKNGFIIPVDNSEALLNKIIELSKMDNEVYKKLVTSTLSYFKELSLTSVCKKTYSIYKEQLAR